MRKRRVLPETNKDPTRRSERAKSRRAVTGKLALRHAFSHRVARGFVSHNRDVVCDLHQRELSRRFEHATTGGDRRRTDILHRRRGLSNTVVQEKPHTLFNTDRARAHATIFEYLRDALVRALVFFPRANVRTHLDQLAGAL